MAVAIVGMVGLWAVVVLERNPLRARWWEHKLVASTAMADRARYLALLANLGPRALPVAQRLLSSKEATVRSYGVVILDQLDDERAAELLRRAADDPDPDVRDGAIHGLAARGDVAALAEIVGAADPEAACVAVEGLGSIGSPQAIDVLVAALRADVAVVVKVQAIECLGAAEDAGAIEVLTACLDDPTVFEGRTAAERSAARALDAVGRDLELEQPGPRTVASFAAAALRRMEVATQPASTSQETTRP